MALVKLSRAIESEYDEPRPDRRTALRHFKEKYRVERRGGTWWVDFSQPVSTGNPRLDAIVRRLREDG